MPEHYTKNTVEASIFCPNCMRMTMWRVAAGRRQWCIPCYERETATLKPQTPAPIEQGNLFAK